MEAGVNEAARSPVGNQSAEQTSIESLVAFAGSFPASWTVQMAYDKFMAMPADFCAVTDGPRWVGLCARSQLGFMLGHRFGFAIHSRLPIVECMLPSPVVVRLGTPIRALLRAALGRDGPEFGHDVVLLDQHGEYIGLIPVPALVKLQGRLVEEKFHALESLQTRLLAVSRSAGMAEIATGILHNVGNVLNSVNVTTSLLSERVRNSRIRNVQRLADLIGNPDSGIPQILQQHPRGAHLSHYLGELARHLESDRENMITEISGLARNIDHIKRIVAFQQSHARAAGMIESVQLEDLVREAISIEEHSLRHYGVEVVNEHQVAPVIDTDRHLVLQILVNLISNAKHACIEGRKAERRITVRLRLAGSTSVAVEVKDNGIGIHADNLEKIFTYGFTTKADGHGFGLHTGALSAHQLGGALQAHSGGHGLGARFTLILPLVPKSRGSSAECTLTAEPAGD